MASQTAKLARYPELDALRGFFLVWMVLTHLPTHMSDFTNDTLGYLSSAAGFVFLSAILLGRIYMCKLLEDKKAVRIHLWKRSLRIYGYHLVMLTLAFTVAAGFAVRTHNVPIYNLLNFYIAHRFVAALGSVLLIYCPPILDILPMYIIFLFLTPWLLTMAARRGWKPVLVFSGAVWLAAQFGLRDIVHNWMVTVTHLQIPVRETGAFDLFAWQAIWIGGLWLGAKSATGELPLRKVSKPMVAACAMVCLFFIGVRYGWFGPHLVQQSLGMQLDKWRIGPLRALNLVCFTIVAYWLRKWVWLLVAREPLLTLGKASLHVFCAHVFFVFIGLGLLYGEVAQLHGLTALALIVVTFIALILVAMNELRKQRRRKQKKSAPKAIPASPVLSTD